MGIGSSHVYADDAQDQVRSSKTTSGLSLNLFSRDEDGGLNLTPSVSLSTPLLDVEVPSIQTNASTSKLSVSELQVDTPLGSAGTSSLDINAKQGTVDLPAVKADTPVIRAEVSGSQVNLNEGTASLPGITAEVPEVIKAETSAVQTNLRQGRAELPSVKLEVPQVTSVEVSSTGVNLSDSKVQLPAVKANVPVAKVKVNLNPRKETVELPVVNPAQPEKQANLSVVQVSENKTPPASKAAGNKAAAGVQDAPGTITRTPVSQAVPVTQDSPNKPAMEKADQDWIQGKLPSVASIDSSKADADQTLPDEQDQSANPWQPRTERAGNSPVVAIAPSAVSTSTGTSSGSSGVTGGGASAPAVALPAAISSLMLPGDPFAFDMERLDGFSQWSQAPPGQPPKYTSFSQTTMA
ncbi:hypothetical protein DFQ00_13625 [Paenibacillus barcinonensis]|nr:hypothetical protein DFQ00_13625 [Paenibacillus barcinonensis]